MHADITLWFLFIILILSDSYKSYNIDTNSPLVKSIQSANQSSFGFSLSVFSSKHSNNKYILVGSPTAQADNSAIKTSGAFYTCPLTKNYMDCVQRSVEEKTADSLFGYSIDSHDVDQRVYTCAPRLLKRHHQVKYVEGSCWELNNEFDETEAISNGNCLNAIKKNLADYEYRNCLTGGAIRGLGNKQVLLTAPYAYEGRGLLINSQFESETNSRMSSYLQVDSKMSKYQLAGFSIAVGRIYRRKEIRTIILGAPGLPHSNETNFKIGFGQVILVELIGNTLAFKALLYGYRFGSGFGYSVLAIDVNGDGFDELIIGAPFTDNNRGKVYVYRNQDRDEWNEAGYIFPLSISKPLELLSTKKEDNGQFGNCLENIGDINMDTYLDFAVSAPFEDDGRGSVYIYLGNKEGNIVMSQKIVAASINSDLRGFGFSMRGQNADLDDNHFPDLVVGSAVSGHIVALRTRPLITIYAENMLPAQDYLISYNLDTLPKCTFDGQALACIEIKISLFYYYTYSKGCPVNTQPMAVTYAADLDRSFLDSSPSKRVHFEDRSSVVKGSEAINCKPPSETSNSSPKRYKVLFPSTTFFNISMPIDVVLNWKMLDLVVPTRDHKAGDTLLDLIQYPVMNKNFVQTSNRVLFGAGCTPESCKPILTLQSELSLPKVDDHYDLYIGSSSSFKLNIDVGNIATIPDNRAYNTFIKMDYPVRDITVSTISQGQYRQTATGLTYAVTSPLEIKALDKIRFEFTLSNDFLQNAQKYIYINISLSAMCPQPHISPTIMKIRIRMIANIEMKVSVMHLDIATYKEMSTLGITAITDEKKIGPKMKLKISLSNLEQASVVVSSKLVILFPWEVSGDPTQSHGQYLLYLLNRPKFFIGGGRRNISCDGESLTNLVNPINTKMFEIDKERYQVEDVSIANISIPKKTPKSKPLKKNLILISNSENSLRKSDWQKNVLLDCMNGSARCVPIVCDMGPLSRQSGEINIELSFRVWIHTFVENFIKYKFVQAHIPIIWVPEAHYDIVLKNPDGAFKIAEIKVDNLQKPKAPPTLDVVWAIVIAIFIGVILLATIVLILYRCHFFRRHNKLTDRRRRKLSKPT